MTYTKTDACLVSPELQQLLQLFLPFVLAGALCGYQFHQKHPITVSPDFIFLDTLIRGASLFSLLKIWYSPCLQFKKRSYTEELVVCGDGLPLGVGLDLSDCARQARDPKRDIQPLSDE